MFTIEFKIFTRRWGHYDTYYITKTECGWKIESYPYSNGICDKKGFPVLFKILKQDWVVYPNILESIMEKIWENPNERQSQSDLLKLARWISRDERNKPRFNSISI